MKAAVTYHRVSTVDQDPTLARDELRRAAAARGLELVAEVEETGSGARNDRPGLRRVLELVDSHQVTHVLVWKLDRFGRSALDLLANVERLKKAGVTFVSTSQGLELGAGAGALGGLMLTMLAAVAEFEREIIRERTRLGHAAARRRGTALGRKPVAISAVMVDRARQLRAGGRAWPTVVRVLRSEGWPAVHPKTLSRAVAGTKQVPGYVRPNPAPDGPAAP